MTQFFFGKLDKIHWRLSKVNKKEHGNKKDFIVGKVI